MTKLKFPAEVKEVKASRTASSDKEWRIVLLSSDEEVKQLQDAIAQTSVKIEVEF